MVPAGSPSILWGKAPSPIRNAAPFTENTSHLSSRPAAAERQWIEAMWHLVRRLEGDSFPDFPIYERDFFRHSRHSPLFNPPPLRSSSRPRRISLLTTRFDFFSSNNQYNNSQCPTKCKRSSTCPASSSRTASSSSTSPRSVCDPPL